MKRIPPPLRVRVIFPLLACLTLACGPMKPAGPPPSTPTAPEQKSVEEKVLGAFQPEDLKSVENMGDASSAATASNAFGFDLYARLRPAEGNLVFSPYSLSSALMTVYAGARGKTAAQMEKTLRLPGEGTDPHALFAALGKTLGSGGENQPFTLRTANALWAQAGSGLLPEYLKLARERYDAGIEEKDFLKNAEAVRAEINAWTAAKTGGRILDLIPVGALTPLTRLVLTNALYFQGEWESRFEPEKTKPAPFRTAQGKPVETPTMVQTGPFRYGETATIQALELPFKRALSMLILLPKEENGLAEVESMLNPGNLKGYLSILKSQDVRVYLPRFKVSSGFAPADALAAMGMPAAFSEGQADFSGMNGKRELFIGAVFHKTFADVNERGVEAAAATGAVMRLKAAEPAASPVIFRADHPFLFLIRHNASGCILFAGRVANPNE